MLTLLLSFALTNIGQTDATFATAVICLIIIIVGFRLAFRLLPPWAGKFVADIIGFFTRILIGTGIKGRK